MRRRTLLGLGAAASGGLVFGTGAFTTVSAQRSVSVSTTGDGDALLTLRPGEENGAFVETDGGTARVDFAQGGLGGGVGTDSRYTFDDTLRVQNRGTQSVFLSTEVDDSSLGDGSLHLFTESPDTPLTAANAVELETGAVVPVGLFVDTTGLETDEFDVDVTIEATVDPPAGGSPPTQPVTDPIPPLQLDSVSSLLASYDDSGTGATGEPLTDDSVIVATAEPTATNTDTDSAGDAVSYGDGTDIPVAALDGRVFAVTGPFVSSDTRFGDFGNEELLLNVFDELLGGTGTVIHDESHGQFYSLSPNGGDDFQSFAEYTRANGYSYGKEGDDLTTVLSGSDAADAVVITSPSEAFTDAELDALSEFVDDGGAVFLHDQSDFNDFDATDNLNEIASGLGVSFRFNDDQVVDEENNAGAEFVPTTTAFNTDQFPELLENRPGLGIEIDPAAEYEVTVTEVTDGDTVTVQFENGESDTVRIVGIDTPETGDTDERIVEYEGITPDQAAELKALAEDGGDVADRGASAYAEDRLAGETVTLSFDSNEPVRGDFGRLLGFLELPDGDVYNAAAVREGWARVYSSGFARHDQYWDLERQAQTDGDGIWQLSDPGSIPESGDEAVSTLFFPEPVAVSGGTTAVESESGEPLVAFDDDANVACVGGPSIDEGFEPSEAGDGPTNDGTQVYPFVSNLVDRLADGGLTDRVVIDGGHGQFGSEAALSAEDVAYYQRYLEGQPDGTDGDESVSLAGANALDSDAGPQLLADDDTLASDALIITTPTEAFTDTERQAVVDFADAGGAVVLVGSAADTDAVENFDPLVTDLGADVEFTTTPVTDSENNLGDQTLPTTTVFPGPDELFTAFTPSEQSSSGGQLAVAEINADAEGPELEPPQENVVFENTGSEPLDLTGYTVSDETSKQYQFPDGFTLDANDQVTLFSGTGTDTDTELYWGRTGTAVWNNGGDTVFVTDDEGTTVIEESYQ
jgi:endonuclease YncB( thermonuclease family)